MSSPYAPLETYATEYYEQHYRQADTAGRDVRRARRVLGRPNVHEERPRRVAPTPPRRRAPSRAEAQTGGEFSGGRGLAQERPVPGAVMDHQRQPVPIRTPTDHLTNGFGSREAARVVRCRVRTGAPDGAGEDDVKCAARVAWAAAQPFRCSRTCLVGRAEPRGAIATAPPTSRSCCSPSAPRAAPKIGMDLARGTDFTFLAGGASVRPRPSTLGPWHDRKKGIAAARVLFLSFERISPRGAVQFVPRAACSPRT